MHQCDICKLEKIIPAKIAVYDTVIRGSSTWAYMCRVHYVLHGSRTMFARLKEDKLND